MAQAAVGRPLGEAHLAHQLRLDPVVLLALGRALGERRRVARERVELLPDRVQQLHVEAGADLGDVDQVLAAIEPDVERAEPAASTSGSVQPPITNSWRRWHLILIQSRPREPEYGAGGALRDDAFEPHLGSRVVERLAVGRDVIAVAHRAERRQRLARARLAVLDGTRRRSASTRPHSSRTCSGSGTHSTSRTSRAIPDWRVKMSAERMFNP